MRIELYYYADCPSHDEALERLRSVMVEVGVAAPIGMTEVRDEGEATALRFLGSPTILVDGRDIDPEAAERTDYALTCRAYRRADGRITPLPPREMIATALRRGLAAAR